MSSESALYFDPTDEEFVDINTNSEDQCHIYDVVASLTSEDYLSLTNEQRKWFCDFQEELQSVEELSLAKEAILKTRALGLSNLKRARASSGAICINDEDGDLVNLDLELRDWNKVQLQTAVIRRLGNAGLVEKLLGPSCLVNGVLDKISLLLYQEIEGQTYKNIICQPSTQSFEAEWEAKRTSSAMTSMTYNVERLPLSELRRIPGLTDNSIVVKVVLGLMAWDNRSFSIALLGPNELTWGTMESLRYVLRLFVTLVSLILNPELEILLKW